MFFSEHKQRWPNVASAYFCTFVLPLVGLQNELKQRLLNPNVISPIVFFLLFF